MSQSRQSKATASAPVAPSPDADALVENYAEDLMDEIFGDVDRILAGDADAIYTETLAQDASEPMVLQAEAVTVPAMIVPFSGEQTGQAAVPLMDALASDTPLVDDLDEQDEEETRRPWRKLVMGVVCLSSVAALGVWWMRQQQPLVQPVATNPAAVSAPTVSEEVAFGEYLKRSLRMISGERIAQADSQSPTAGVATAPTATSPATAGNQPAGRPGVIERVFVPLLQPGSRAAQNPVKTPSTRTGTLPAPNVAAAPATGDQQTTSPRETAVVPNIAATNTHELVGVLELGDRSAALFEVNGTSQRVYIGEAIGSSGWNVVSIENEEVVVRRNGEVRSIYIGQQF